MTKGENVLRMDHVTKCGSAACHGDKHHGDRHEDMCPASAAEDTEGSRLRRGEECDHRCRHGYVADSKLLISRDSRSQNNWLWNLLSIEKSSGSVMAESMLGKYFGVDRAATKKACNSEREVNKRTSARRTDLSKGCSQESSGGSKQGPLEVPLVSSEIGPGSEMSSEPSIVVSNSVFRVDGMCCANEALVINKMFERLPGVNKTSVDVLGRTCVVEHISKIVSPSTLLDMLNEKGLRSVLISCSALGGAESGDAMRKAVETAAKHAKANRFPKWYVIIGTFCWFISLLHFAEQIPWYHTNAKCDHAWRHPT